MGVYQRAGDERRQGSESQTDAGQESIAMRNALSTASSGLSSSAHAASLPSAQPAIMDSPGKGHVNWAFFFSNVRCV